MPAYKKGATLGIEIEFTEDEWAEIYPWDEILSECENATTEYPLTITTDVQARTILLSSPTDITKRDSDFDEAKYRAAGT